MHVLVVEDEEKIAGFVCRGLKEEGFSVDHCDHGDEAYERIQSHPYDVVMLDIMLPGRDGLSILRALRQEKNAVPVILLTARSALDERIEGLNLGADDYLAKPFFVEELVARLHALVRRSTGAEQSVLREGDLSVNLLTREVQRGDAQLSVTSREFNLLEYLMRSPGRIPICGAIKVGVQADAHKEITPPRCARQCSRIYRYLAEAGASGKWALLTPRS